MIFLISDTHFAHNKSFLYEPRGFTNIQEHDAQIIKNWNKVVSFCDDVYHLGDVMLGDNEYGLSCLKQLNGKIHIICGNHCTDARRALYESCYNVEEVIDIKRLRFKGYNFYLSHYPTITSNYDIDKPLKARVINLCGHSHTKDPFVDWDKGLVYHCELEAHDNKPVLLDDIIIDIKNKLKENE